jgi:hypothetical protein
LARVKNPVSVNASGSSRNTVKDRVNAAINMIRAIFCDKDCVLVDTERLYFQATRELLSEVGVTLTEALFKQISLFEGRNAFDLAKAKGVSR